MVEQMLKVRRFHRHDVQLAARESLRIGLAIPLSGPGGIFGASCEAVAELCVEQLNEAGVAGRQVEIEVIDAGAPPAAVAAEVEYMLRQGRLDALTGWHISSVREKVAPLTLGRIPYLYTSLYEGGENRPGVFCAGETPVQQIAPALAWLREALGCRRWHLIGNDYVWPRRTAQLVVEFAHDLDLEIVQQQYVPLGVHRFEAQLESLRRVPADGVLLFLVGQDAVDFNRVFAASGLDEQLLRFSPLMEENMLLASGVEATHDLYVSAGYFRGLRTTNSMDLVGSFVERFGPDAPPLNNQAESCYEGITLLARLIDAAQCTHVECLIRASEGIGFDGPRGPVHLDQGQMQQRVHLARADGFDFEIITDL